MIPGRLTAQLSPDAVRHYRQRRRSLSPTSNLQPPPRDSASSAASRRSTASARGPSAARESRSPSGIVRGAHRGCARSATAGRDPRDGSARRRRSKTPNPRCHSVSASVGGSGVVQVVAKTATALPQHERLRAVPGHAAADQRLDRHVLRAQHREAQVSQDRRVAIRRAQVLVGHVAVVPRQRLAALELDRAVDADPRRHPPAGAGQE